MGKPPKKVPKGKDSNQAFTLNEMDPRSCTQNQNKLVFTSWNLGSKKTTDFDFWR